MLKQHPENPNPAPRKPQPPAQVHVTLIPH